VFGLFTSWFRAPALLAGWAVGLFGGTYLAWSDGLKPPHALMIADSKVTVYVGVIALVANVVTAAVVYVAVGTRQRLGKDHSSSPPPRLRPVPGPKR